MKRLLLALPIMLLGCGTPPKVEPPKVEPEPSITVWIDGPVGKPGKYEISPDKSLRRLIAGAGGLLNPAGDFVTLARWRADGKSQTFAFKLSKDVTATFPQLQDGDVVVVSSRPLPDYSAINDGMDIKDRLPIEVLVVGAVKMPARYQMRTGDDVWTVIEKAGGAIDLGIKTVRITRYSQDGQHRVFSVPMWEIHYRDKTAPLLRDGDVIFCQPGCWGF